MTAPENTPSSQQPANQSPEDKAMAAAMNICHDLHEGGVPGCPGMNLVSMQDAREHIATIIRQQFPSPSPSSNAAPKTEYASDEWPVETGAWVLIKRDGEFLGHQGEVLRHLNEFAEVCVEIIGRSDNQFHRVNYMFKKHELLVMERPKKPDASSSNATANVLGKIREIVNRKEPTTSGSFDHAWEYIGRYDEIAAIVKGDASTPAPAPATDAELIEWSKQHPEPKTALYYAKSLTKWLRQRPAPTPTKCICKFPTVTLGSDRCDFCMDKFSTRTYDDPPTPSASPADATKEGLSARLNEAIRKNFTDRLVDAFLSWPLPKTVCCDPCCTTKDYPHSRLGTSLLTATEARQMIEHLFATTCPPGLPSSDREAEIGKLERGLRDRQKLLEDALPYVEESEQFNKPTRRGLSKKIRAVIEQATAKALGKAARP